jgi:hypothetical protein
MPRRTIPRAAAGTTAVLALAFGLLIGQGGSASAASPALSASGHSLNGATVASSGKTTAPSSASTSAPSAGKSSAPSTPAAPTSSGTPAPAASGDVRRVTSAAELQAALKAARPGQVIQMADGNYAGRFVVSVSGTSAKPIVLRGGRGAVLNGGAAATGMALQLQRANYWRLEGFTVRGAQKGVVLDSSNHNVLSKLDVGQSGMEGVHFRSSSSDNRLEGSDVHHTGRVNAGFGEGVYIGSAISNWGKYGNSGGMDRSDRNVITGNRIHAVTAENIDIKEGTVSGEISGNVLEGDGMTGVHHGDSWIDVKGNRYLIANNTGTRSRLDGIQTHVQAPGWGRDNTFRGNKLTVNAKGYGINIYNGAASGNRVACDNQAPGAAAGVSNIRCS